MPAERDENPRNGFRKSDGVKETEMPPAKRSKFFHKQDGRVWSKWKRQANGDVLLNLVSVDLNVVCDSVDAADKVQELEVEILHENDVAFGSGESTIAESSTLPSCKAVENGALAEDKMHVVNVASSLDKSRWVSGDVSSIRNSSGHSEHRFSKVSSADKHSIPVGQRSGSSSDDDNIENDSSIVTEEDWHDSKRAVASPCIPMNGTTWNCCRSVFDYEMLNKINEGSYGVVYRARDKKTGEIVALKKLKMEGKTNSFPTTALREINFLMSLDHPSLVRGKEVVMGDIDSVFVVMEYVEHDLNGVLEVMEYPFSISEVKCLMIQLLQGVKFLHDNWIIHRDLKSSNILFNNRGELKICDFGLARPYSFPLKPYTAEVVTLWYRAPEILFEATKDSEYVYYAEAIDMWSVGCIMGELLSNETLFRGKSEIDQINKIIKLLGTPNDTIWPGFSDMRNARKLMYVYQPYNLLRKKFPVTSFTGSPALSDAGFDLLNQMLTYDPVKRITVDQALDHRWFREVPLAKDKEFMPTYPAQNEKDRTCESSE